MRRKLCLFMAFVLLLMCFPTSVFADKAVWGSSEGGISRVTVSLPKPGSPSYDPSRVPGGAYMAFNGYNRGSAAVRMKAVPLDESKRDQQDYFTATYPFNTPNGEVYMLDHSRLVQAPGYFDDNWIYFSNANHPYVLPIIQAFGEGAVSSTIYPPGSDKQNELLAACGYKGNKNIALTDSRNLDSVLHCDAMENDEDGSRRKELAKFFGLTGQDAESFYIVVELVPFMREYFFGHRTMDREHDTGYGLVYVDDVYVAGLYLGTQMEWMVAESLATYNINDPKTNGRPALAFGPVNESFAEGIPLQTGSQPVKNFVTFLETKTNWRQGEEALFDGYTTVNRLADNVQGYSIYSFMKLPVAQVGGNVAVEYQGDVNTSDPSEFVSTGSLVNKGTSTARSYWDFGQSKWIDSDDESALLKFAGEIDTSDDYALCFTGTAQHDVTVNDIKLTQDLQKSFEEDPGKDYNSGSLFWGSPLATGGQINIGHVWKVMTLDGFDNVGPIKTRFENSFNAAQTSGKLNTADEFKTTEKYKDYDVLEGSWLNALEGFSLSSTDVLEKGVDGSYSFKRDKQLGMGYEFIIRGTPVLSQEITMYVTADEDNNVEDVSSAQTWEERYTTAKNVVHEVTEEDGWDFCGWVVVPKQEQSVTNSVESSLRSAADARVGTLLQAAISGASGGPVVKSDPAATTLGIGSTKEDKPPEGYTVYKILRQGPPPPQVTGTVVLPAYMLNRYFNNVIQTSSQIKGVPERITLASDWTWVKWTTRAMCCKPHDHGPKGFDRDWVHEYRDTASSEEFGLDNAMIDRYYPKGTGNWSGAQRSKLYGHGWTQPVDTEGMSDTANVVDYAFNLVRNNNGFGDARSISGISYKTYVAGTGDSDDLLRIKSKFGVVPATVKRASPSRNSNAALATYDEVFNIESRFQHDASPTGNHVNMNNPWSCTHSHGSGKNKYTHTVSGTYSTTYPVTIKGFYGIASGYSDKITYSFSNTAFKYTTKNDLGKGKNDFLGTAQSKPLTAGRRNSTAGSITPSNFYRYTTVRYSGVDLLFHPENYMVFKIGGTDFATINTQNYKAAYVMSEVKRTSQGSGMYFFRLNADITSVPGTVYSDSMQGGTGMMGLGGDLVSIPAGSDVTIAADPTGVAIDLYGYALDIVQTEDDGKIGAVGSGRPYNTVVADGEDAYSKWGNDSRAKIKEHFEKWCADMLEVENYAADFQLFVGNSPASGDLKSENFSATIGSVEKGAGVAEEGIYQLVVEKGVLVESKGDYNALISQISTDYGCSTAEAKQMFKESAIYTAIINGMETCKNPKNKSGDVFQGLNYTPDILASWNGVLGGDGNWYDETSRTFVIRRFTNLGNKLCDVIATDKIDYQLAPEGNNRFGEGVNGGVSFEGWWKLNIFFDQNRASEVNDLLLGSSHYYDPQNGSAGFNPANNAYSVLFNGIPVADANFKIPASSTQDFYN